MRRAEKASGGNLSSFVRAALVDRLRVVEHSNGNDVVAHIKARAGSWDGSISGVDLLKRTRP